MGKTLANCSRFAKFVKVFPHHCFALYAIIILAAMTYNQVQSFQINDYANHYVNIEITGYRDSTAKALQAGWS